MVYAIEKKMKLTIQKWASMTRMRCLLKVFCHWIKQIDSILPCACEWAVIAQRRCQIVVRR